MTDKVGKKSVHAMWELVSTTLHGSRSALALGTPVMIRCEGAIEYYYLSAHMSDTTRKDVERGKLQLADAELNIDVSRTVADASLWRLVPIGALDESKGEGKNDAMLYAEYDPHMLFLEHLETGQRLHVIRGTDSEPHKLGIKAHAEELDLFTVHSVPPKLTRLVTRVVNKYRIVSLFMTELNNQLSKLRPTSRKGHGIHGIHGKGHGKGHGIQHVLDQLVHDFQRHRDCVIGSDGLESVNGLRLVAHTKYADRQRWDSKEFRPARDLLEFLCDIPNVDLARRAIGHLNKVEPARARYPKH